ncbi:MAG: hypothetical protein ACXADY_18625 [Candidatus Hodarchaeales archaeon]|jgi:hypothetical protein
MTHNNEEETDKINTQGQEKELLPEGISQYFHWLNEDWLSLFIGLFIVLLALLGLLDWVKW